MTVLENVMLGPRIALKHPYKAAFRESVHGLVRHIERNSGLVYQVVQGSGLRIVVL